LQIMKLFAAALALALPVAGWAQVPQAVEPLVPATGTVLDVTAEGRTTRVPDLAVIRAGVTTEAPTAAAAMAENARRMARVLAALRRAGIAARDLTTAQVSLQPRYRDGENQTPTIAGYQATNTASVRFRDVAQAGPILDTLVAEGANQIAGPALSLSEPDAALDEARTDAMRRARARAEIYARAAGLRVERLVSVEETGQNAGGPPPMIFMARRAADSATEVAPGETDVTVSLRVRYLLR
jgi:uncharacterized protein